MWSTKLKNKHKVLWRHNLSLIYILLHSCLRWNKSVHYSVHLHCSFLILECSTQSIVLKWTILKIFKNFQGRRKKFKDNNMFLKNQGHNAYWEQIQGQSLALKDVWQPHQYVPLVTTKSAFLLKFSNSYPSSDTHAVCVRKFVPHH